MSTYMIAACTVDVGEDSVTTTFPDGSVLYAGPAQGGLAIAQERFADELGYDSVAAMNRHHDLLHTLIAEARGLECSATLHGVATGNPVAQEVADDEERLVFLVARLINKGLDGVLADRLTQSGDSKHS